MAYYAVERSGSLAHYGRLGMKWYQHIYGTYQGTAKYAAKGQKKINRLQAKTDKKNAKIDKKIANLKKKAPAKGRFDRNQYKINNLQVKKTQNSNKLWDLRFKVADVRNKADDIKNGIEPKETRFKEYEATLKDDGWKRNDKYAFGDSTNFEKKIKVGKEEVLIEATCDRKEDPAAFKERITRASNAIVKNNDSIKASIAKEAYKELQDMGGSTRGVTKDQFQKGLTMSLVSLGRMLNEVSYDDTTGLYGDHFFTAEVDDKGKYYRYSMNG